MKLEDLPRRFQLDEEIVLVAVGQNGLALEKVDEELKGNKRLVMAAVKQVRGLWRRVAWRGVAWCGVEGHGAHTNA